MVELIGDTCQPSDLIIPVHEGYIGANQLSGMTLMSGGKLLFYTGAAWETITSA